MAITRQNRNQLDHFPIERRHPGKAPTH